MYTSIKIPTLVYNRQDNQDMIKSQRSYSKLKSLQYSVHTRTHITQLFYQSRVSCSSIDLSAIKLVPPVTSTVLRHILKIMLVIHYEHWLLALAYPYYEMLVVCPSVYLLKRSRDPERFSPALRHGQRWVIQAAEH